MIRVMALINAMLNFRFIKLDKKFQFLWIGQDLGLDVNAIQVPEYIEITQTKDLDLPTEKYSSDQIAIAELINSNAWDAVGVDTFMVKWLLAERNWDFFHHPQRIYNLVIAFDNCSPEDQTYQLLQKLNNAGFTRYFPEVNWFDDQILLCAFTTGVGDGFCLDVNTWMEWWRRVQASQVRNILMREYQVEMGELTSFLSANYEQRIQDLENRWEAFQQSRTGKLISFFQRAFRKRLF